MLFSNIVISLLIILIGVLGFGCFNLLRQIEVLEEMNLSYQTKLDKIAEKTLLSEERLIELDAKGSFAADDEVGFVFRDIREINTELANAIQEAYDFD
jgi:hypothetical protein